LAAAAYGTDKAIFAFGYATTFTSVSNLVTNTGVVGSDVTGVGTARATLAATNYGLDTAFFGFGYSPVLNSTSVSNLVSNTGVVATDTTNASITGKSANAAASYGT
jgi:hypothetical protein